MYNQFLYRQLVFLLVVSIFFSYSITGQESGLYGSRDLDLSTSIHEALYHHAVQSIDVHDDIVDAQSIDKQKVIGLLHTRYPELAYSIERTPKQTLEGDEISKLMIDILKSETSTGVGSVGDSFWTSVEGAELTAEEKSSFKFLYGYSLFKEKKWDEAQRIFAKIAKERKGEYEYAFYYDGLIALLQKEYGTAHELFTKVGKDARLATQTPYYLAASHYGLGNYDEIISFYAPRLNETHLHNIRGLAQIVGYAQYKNEDYPGAIASLSKLGSAQELTSEENYVLGIAYQRIGNHEKSSAHLSKVQDVQEDIASKASYEHALNLAHQQKNAEAIGAFEGLIKSGHTHKHDIHMNLSLIHISEPTRPY